MNIFGILNIIIIGIFALIPILGWAYLFSYLDNSNLNSKRFISGMIAGAFSVVPVLYLEDILGYFKLDSYGIFGLIVRPDANYFTIIISVLITILLISIFMYITGLFFKDHDRETKNTYIKNTISLFVISIIFAIVYLITNNVGFFSKNIGEKSIEMGKLIFNTIGLITLYYIIIGLLEEMSKHFGFLTSSLSSSEDIKKGVIYGVFIALGFGFIENILYTTNNFNNSGYSGSLFSLLFFRSLFSLLVHIICSVMVVKIFLNGYYLLKNNKINLFTYSKTFLISIIFSIIVHSIYDISLTLGFTMIIFIYFLFGYLYITKIFYRES